MKLSRFRARRDSDQFDDAHLDHQDPSPSSSSPARRSKLPLAMLLPFVRALEFLFSVVVLGLAAATISGQKSAYGGYVPVDAFALFVGIFSVLCVLFFIFHAAKSPKKASQDEYEVEGAGSSDLMVLALNVLCMLFWFCAFIATAAKHGPGSCDWKYNIGGVLYVVTPPSPDYCKLGKAIIAMSAVTWALFMISTALLVVKVFCVNGRRREGATSRNAQRGSRGMNKHSGAPSVISDPDPVFVQNSDLPPIEDEKDGNGIMPPFPPHDLDRHETNSIQESLHNGLPQAPPQAPPQGQPQGQPQDQYHGQQFQDGNYYYPPNNQTQNRSPQPQDQQFSQGSGAQYQYPPPGPQGPQDQYQYNQPHYNPQYNNQPQPQPVGTYTVEEEDEHPDFGHDRHISTSSQASLKNNSPSPAPPPMTFTEPNHPVEPPRSHFADRLSKIPRPGSPSYNNEPAPPMPKMSPFLDQHPSPVHSASSSHSFTMEPPKSSPFSDRMSALSRPVSPAMTNHNRSSSSLSPARSLEPPPPPKAASPFTDRMSVARTGSPLSMKSSRSTKSIRSAKSIRSTKSKFSDRLSAIPYSSTRSQRAPSTDPNR
uniref:ARAD1A10296p n=1 Tax=Blastobotrys adeninivorans TaxID=409370 RepID=A0A060T3J6_BLAAD